MNSPEQILEWLNLESHTPGYLPAVDREKFSDAHKLIKETLAKLKKVSGELAFYDNKCDACGDHLGLLRKCPHCKEIQRLTSELGAAHEALKHLHWMMGNDTITTVFRSAVCAYIDSKLPEPSPVEEHEAGRIELGEGGKLVYPDAETAQTKSELPPESPDRTSA